MGSHGNGVCRQFQHRMSTGPPRTFAPASTTRNAQTEIPQQDRPPECAEILVLFAHGRVLWRRWQLSEPHGSQFWRSWTQTEESLKPSPTGQALPADSGNPQIQKSLPATDGDDWPYRLFVEALPRLGSCSAVLAVTLRAGTGWPKAVPRPQRASPGWKPPARNPVPAPSATENPEEPSFCFSSSFRVGDSTRTHGNSCLMDGRNCTYPCRT